MTHFDPSKPIDDPEVWCPQGMYVEDESDPNGDPIFILAQSDMASLNRFLWNGKQLPTTRDEYKASLGIIDGSEISKPVWEAADKTLSVYGAVRIHKSPDGTWLMMPISPGEIE